MQHNFADSLAFSHAASDLPIWEGLYREAFPGFLTMVDHRQDGEHQRAGIDRSIILENSKQIFVDEKVRGRNKKTGKVYDDIFLETWSDWAHRKPGWAAKPLRADYIAYAIAPLGRCYLLPVLAFQKAFALSRETWKAAYGEKEVQNDKWVTLGIPVPVDVLFGAIGKSLRLRFTPFEI